MPAPIVSPPRLSRMRPMSLFTEKGSNGMGLAVAMLPTDPVRKAICTSAETPFVNTLVFETKSEWSLVSIVHRSDLPWFLLNNGTVRTVYGGQQCRNCSRYISRLME